MTERLSAGLLGVPWSVTRVEFKQPGGAHCGTLLVLSLPGEKVLEFADALAKSGSALLHGKVLPLRQDGEFEGVPLEEVLYPQALVGRAACRPVPGPIDPPELEGLAEGQVTVGAEER